MQTKPYTSIHRLQLSPKLLQRIRVILKKSSQFRILLKIMVIILYYNYIVTIKSTSPDHTSFDLFFVRLTRNGLGL